MKVRNETAPPLLSARLAYTILESAELAAVSASTIRRAIESNELKAARLGSASSAIRIRAVDLDRWLMQRAGSSEPAVVPAQLDVTGGGQNDER